MISIHTVLRKAQLRWAGHVVRMPKKRLPKKIFYGELQHGKRFLGGQKKRYKDGLKTSLKTFQMDPNNWEELAADRESWRSKIRSGAENHEARRLNDAQEKRAKRKERLALPLSMSAP
jgi:hypothetical protein